MSERQKLSELIARQRERAFSPTNLTDQHIQKRYEAYRATIATVLARYHRYRYRELELEPGQLFSVSVSCSQSHYTDDGLCAVIMIGGNNVVQHDAWYEIATIDEYWEVISVVQEN